MKVLVQWARAQTSNWMQIDSRDWKLLAKRPRPNGDSLDSKMGWVAAVNIQGVVMCGDSYAIEDLPDGSVQATSVERD